MISREFCKQPIVVRAIRNYSISEPFIAAIMANYLVHENLLQSCYKSAIMKSVEFAIVLFIINDLCKMVQKFK